MQLDMKIYVVWLIPFASLLVFMGRELHQILKSLMSLRNLFKLHHGINKFICGPVETVCGKVAFF